MTQERSGIDDHNLPEDTPFVPPAWHVRELERRVAEAEAAPGDVECWEDVYARLSRKAMSLRTKADDERAENFLRERLAEGVPLEEAIRATRFAAPAPALFLCPIVERVAGVTPTEAKRLVARALMTLSRRGPRLLLRT
ncbi:MAG: hypothetical protein K2W96_09740 [Gemmataceae bacterium]|nr:hypothetical protein [Gemmataceae bacterium]